MNNFLRFFYNFYRLTIADKKYMELKKLLDTDDTLALSAFLKKLSPNELLAQILKNEYRKDQKDGDYSVRYNYAALPYYQAQSGSTIKTLYEFGCPLDIYSKLEVNLGPTALTKHKLDIFKALLECGLPVKDEKHSEDNYFELALEAYARSTAQSQVPTITPKKLYSCVEALINFGFDIHEDIGSHQKVRTYHYSTLCLLAMYANSKDQLLPIAQKLLDTGIDINRLGALNNRSFTAFMMCVEKNNQHMADFFLDFYRNNQAQLEKFRSELDLVYQGNMYLDLKPLIQHCRDKLNSMIERHTLSDLVETQETLAFSQPLKRKTHKI